MSLKKKISSAYEDTQLLTVFQSYFSNHLNLARIRLICLFINALCKVKSVNFSKLSLGFDSKTSGTSNYRRIQRFFKEVDFPLEFVAKFIFALLLQQDSLVLVMDRTNWKFGSNNINILMLGVSYKNIAFPILFKMMDKRGNSNTAERIDLIQKFKSVYC